jgi:hypothetical protein
MLTEEKLNEIGARLERSSSKSHKIPCRGDNHGLKLQVSWFLYFKKGI